MVAAAPEALDVLADSVVVAIGVSDLVVEGDAVASDLTEEAAELTEAEMLETLKEGSVT